MRSMVEGPIRALNCPSTTRLRRAVSLPSLARREKRTCLGQHG